ncbi:MAG TPA: decaprenyl-phosphate phosphoribosyltransferase [Actinocrinis sp.]|nr:decaprenyl-phosphate phosphoribosyltransferase [Actinocrinis sp.]
MPASQRGLESDAALGSTAGPDSALPGQEPEAVTAPEPGAAPATGGGLIGAMVREARPKQWVKNVLVFTAPLAAGKIGHADTLGYGAIAFAAFCLAASAVYYANDALDVESDRRHPKKRFRPIAAGLVPIRLAWVVVVLLSAAAIAVALTANPATAVVIAIYLAMHLAYSAWFKHVLVLDLVMVAAGFLLRSMIGGIAAGIPLSQWFLLTTGFGSLFMVAGKRYSELKLMGDDAGLTRKSLADYSASYLQFVWQMAAGLTILTYSLWAFQMSQGAAGVPWHEISIVPWTFVFLRYAMFVDQGKAGEPEDVVLGDRMIMVLGAVWLACFAFGVFNGR